MTTANIETNHGKISFELLPDLAPETVRNFEKLTKDCNFSKPSLSIKDIVLNDFDPRFYKDDNKLR